MTEPFDPSISSSDYLALARERHLAGTSKLIEELSWMLDYDAYDCGLDKKHVAILLDPLNWSAAVRNENRRPRVFLDARVNQKGNAEINSARGDHEILFDEDFVARYAASARSYDSVPWRGLGELMWWKGYELLVSNVIIRKSPAAAALLYAHAARLAELSSFLAQHVTLVGSVALNFTYQEGQLTAADFVPTIPADRLQEMIKERGQRTAVRLREAVARMVPKDDPE